MLSLKTFEKGNDFMVCEAMILNTLITKKRKKKENEERSLEQISLGDDE